MANIAATWSSAQYYCIFMTRAKTFSDKKDFLIHATKQCNIDGLHLEFGVANGHTIRIISSAIKEKIYGFDCFDGLPEDWRSGFEKGQFAQPIPSVPENAELVIGLFNETLPDFIQRHKEPVAFLHIDCDLYSSTKTIFDHLGDRIIPGTIIVFDEYLNYPGWQLHEYKAFQEFAKERKLEYSYLSIVPMHQQACVRIDKVENVCAN
ncbi:MAG: class I SAM-dependent methyltransferase [Desulfobulbus sp.]|nr:class I SAM-dependent methyltransferase [Desulfobulbus sp.]